MNPEIIFLNTRETIQFLDKDIYNPTCTNGAHEPFMFEFMKLPLTNHKINLELKNFADIDKSKTWFIDLPLFPYTWNNLSKNTNKNLFKCFPDYILQECILGKAYLVFNNQNETDTESIFSLFYQLYEKNPIVPMSKIIFLSPSKNAKKQYHRWANEKNIPKEQMFKVLHCNHIDLRFNDYDVNFWNKDLQVEKKKTFINLNRAIRPQRVFLVSAMCELGLLDKGNVSLWYEGSKENFFNELTTRRDFFNYSKEGKDLYDLIWSGMNKVVDKLPIYIDITDKNINPAGFSNSDIAMYKESYINVTSTTFFFNWQEPCYGWNEKEWKPILARQPFMLFSRPGALQDMKDFGIVTFDKYIDESYDLIEDDINRFWAVLREIQRLSNLDKTDLDKIIKETNHIVDYNIEYVTSKRYENIFYTGGLKEFIGLI